MRRSVAGCFEKYELAKVAVATQPIQSGMVGSVGREWERAGLADSQRIGADLLPILQHEPMRFEHGLDHFVGRRCNQVEREMVTVETVQQSRQQANVFLQTDSLACFDQMLAPYAAIFRIMQQQIRQFRSLLDQMGARQPSDLLLE